MMDIVQAAGSPERSYVGLQSQQRIDGHSVFRLHVTHLFLEGSGYGGLASLTIGEDLRGCERIRADSILVTAFTDCDKIMAAQKGFHPPESLRRGWGV